LKIFLSNIIANFAGKVFVALLAIFLVPVYIRYLGIESYGLVGFYTTLTGSLTILDFGLSTTLNRELSKARALNTPAHETRNLVFTLECIYWVIGLLVCLVVVAFSGLIADKWINAEGLDAFAVKKSIMLMGLVLAFQWPIGLYQGGFMGLEKQVLFNIITVVMMSLRAFGVIFILGYISTTIEAFFIWQVIVYFFYVVWMRISLWKQLPRSNSKVIVSIESVKKIWRFAAGLTSTGLVTFFLTQADKVLLSKILPLKEFGYYMLAYTISSSMAIFITPVSSAVFPRLSAFVAGGQQQQLIRLYHHACRMIATIIMPIAITVIFFAPQVLQVWLKDETTVAHTSEIARVLVAGSMLNALMMTPYLLTLSFGWTKFSFYQNLIAAILLVPLLFWLAAMYGSVGAAFVWLIVNAGAVIVSIPLLHKKILPGQTQRWYLQDNLVPFVVAVLCCGVLYLIFANTQVHLSFNYFTIAVLFGFVSIISLLQFPGLKNHLSTFIRGKK